MTAAGMPESNERSVNLWPSIDFRSIRKFRMSSLFSLVRCIAPDLNRMNINKNRMVEWPKTENQSAPACRLHTKTAKWEWMFGSNWISKLACKSNQFTCQPNTHGLFGALRGRILCNASNMFGTDNGTDGNLSNVDGRSTVFASIIIYSTFASHAESFTADAECACEFIRIDRHLYLFR